MKNLTKIHMYKHMSIPKIIKKNRRGLSTVVSSAIIMSAVSIMGVMLVGWSNTNLFNQQIEIENSFNDKMNKLNESLLIENIWFGTSPNVVNVTMTNYGFIGLNVTQIKMVNSTDTLIFTITDGGMQPSTDFSIQETYNWNPGETVDFSVTTNRGNIITSQEVT